ncbi:hypothetical protein E6C67_13105 [Azospirillum sp. TSA2s]|uniref:hypothetical protein n=1 Tax=Azospirillum sp. TSA2s TaxID=709810 RepID=UPI0010AB3408|nr:hypothetical protein [Azospirillum sp. TSA2s]QCG94799.1 hypothetical protein E6C67_13105 [Azospirillum sp. TSA2s]
MQHGEPLVWLAIGLLIGLDKTKEALWPHPETSFGYRHGATARRGAVLAAATIAAPTQRNHHIWPIAGIGRGRVAAEQRYRQKAKVEKQIW